tara:strand:+ start:353 stop:1558 length:1206 start_codon:yes stop_codon:yes gene_type:complete
MASQYQKLTGNKLLEKIDLLKNESKFNILNKCGYINKGGNEIGRINHISLGEFFKQVITAHALKNKDSFGKVNMPKRVSIRSKIDSYKTTSYKQEYIPKCFKDNVDKTLSGKYIDLCISIGHINESGNISHGKVSSTLRKFFKAEESFTSRKKVDKSFNTDLQNIKHEKSIRMKLKNNTLKSDENLDKSLIIERDILKGIDLIEKVLELNNINKPETSICINTGYKIDKIGTFRRAFAKAAGVQLAPLSRMLKELKDNKLFINKNGEKGEKQEIFIDRERIESRVKRLYRDPKFRKKVLQQHGTVCCCCNIKIENLIEAAHIIPVENKGNDDINNGIPLCPTHHAAFDNFLFVINPHDNLIIYKEGLNAEDIQITKTKCELNISKDSLEFRLKLFNGDIED